MTCIEVLDVQNAQPTACATYTQGHNNTLRLQWNTPFNQTALPYALFPFQGQLNRSRTEVEKPPAKYIERGSFIVRVRCPKPLSEDVKTAIWAWVNFGGLGARTRRGCGSLYCKELAPKNRNDIRAWFQKNTVPHSPSARDWPVLPSDFLVGLPTQKPFDAWQSAIEVLQQFLQGVNFARNPGNQPNRPGRSRWPEPETNRSVKGSRSREHLRFREVPDDAFPRAELGLPIVFHYKDYGEPPDTVLYPANGLDGQRDRMASPLIIKPLVLADGQSVPMIILLVTRPLAAVDLREKQGNNEVSLTLPLTTVIRSAKLATYPNSPLAASSTGSALEAFYAFAKRKGFTQL
jgi:CRISPR-associated protein Cmr1